MPSSYELLLLGASLVSTHPETVSHGFELAHLRGLQLVLVHNRAYIYLFCAFLASLEPTQVGRLVGNSFKH